jgi:hypothetical protein
MDGYLSAFDCKAIIGESIEQEREFFSATVQPEFREAKARRFAVGICSEGHGIAPQLLPLPNRGLLLFGLNSEIVAIRADTGLIAYRVPLGFLFRSMVPLPDSELILVFHEIGVTALREDGETSWTFGRDVLEDAWVEDGSLRMTFMDSEPATVELTSGRELR